MGYPRRGVASLVLTKAGWLFGLAALVGFALVIPGLGNLKEGWALSTQGEEAQGQVSDMQITTRSCGKKNMDTCTDYTLAFDFMAAGVMTHGTATVGQSTYHALTLHGPITVRYLPADPSQTEVEEGTTLISGVALTLAALAFLGLGLWGLQSRLTAARRMLRLREDGVAQRVRVTALVDARTKINNAAMWRITWADAAGLASKSRLHKQTELPQPGAEITIYADPSGHQPSVWEGDCGTR